MTTNGWTHKVVKVARGGDGKWFDFPTAYTGSEAECLDYARHFAASQRGVLGAKIVVRSRRKAGQSTTVEIPAAVEARR